MTIAPMPRTRTVAETISAHLASDIPPAAIIFVDGEEFKVFDDADEARRMAQNAQSQIKKWNEISLMIYKPRHQAYLRTMTLMR